MDFAGQVIWITGASSGIGEASARAFAAAGAHVILSSRRPAELERVRQSLPEPGRHRVLPLDLARPESFPDAVAAALAHWGHVDVLVNNGGVSQRALALETEAAVERALMEVDYFGPVALTKALLPAMLARRRGQVVVVSSVMGYLGTPGRSTYAAAKHALHGYFDSLRAEVWRHGIRVTLVCPGYVRTAVGRNALGPRGETRDAVPHGITPERCARALLRGVARGRAEVHVGGWEMAGIYLQRLAPGLLRWLVRRMTFTVHPGR